MKMNDGVKTEHLSFQRNSLVSEFMKKSASSDFLHQHADLLDEYFRRSYEKSMVGPTIDLIKNPYAIVALGGYGRAEQCVHSDIDLLFLFHENVPREAEALIREIVYPLWDMGIEVGHATRSIKECVELARSKFEVLTSLLDARFVCGMSRLYSHLSEEIRQEIITPRSGEIIRWLVDSNRQRHQRFGDSSYLLEPNLKEGQGGLRDYHTMLWVAHVKSNLKHPRDLEYYGFLSHAEFKSLEKSLGFIWMVRNRLHHMAGRKWDQLLFEYQIKLARALDFRKTNSQESVERFLGKLHGEMGFLKELHLMFLYEQGYTSRKERRRKTVKKTVVEGLLVKRDRLAFASPEAIVKQPLLLMEIFKESSRLKIPLGIEAKRLVREFSFLMDEMYVDSPLVVKCFEQILVTHAPDFNVLNEMLNTDVLVVFIPQMKAIIDRIQHDQYHLYPVDRHSLRVVQTIKGFATPGETLKDSLCANLYKELKHRKPLLWAALLHDIGKGVEGPSHSDSGAEITREILIKKGLVQKDVETISFLVKSHLRLIITATRRDISDEETAISFAREIKDVGRLKMLYLLTVADSMATGPKAWNEWAAALLRSFFLKVLNILEGGELANSEAVAALEEKKAKALALGGPSRDPAGLERLFALMSPRYLLYTTAENMLTHADLHGRMSEGEFAWKIEKVKDVHTRHVTICAKDRPGLFSKIAGVFTLNGLDILASQIFTWRNNIALDIFDIVAPRDQIREDERWLRAEKDLEDALSGKLDLAAALKKREVPVGARKPDLSRRPHKVVVNNTGSSFFTIIEVFAYDFPGLLFGVTDALFRCKLDIWVAKIATSSDQVVDVFYVRDFDGQKVDSPELTAVIRTSIEAVILNMGAI
jgi:[protein-PII] uridylyltransferase